MPAAQDELLGQLDVATADAEMARWALAEVQATVAVLEEEARNEREVSTAARRRTDAVERQVADHEREVRSAAVSGTTQTLQGKLLF